MVKHKKNNIIIYGLVTVIVVGFLYLLFSRKSEGFTVLTPTFQSDRIIYETIHVASTSKEKDVKINGSDLFGKTIKDFFVEYNACDGKWYKLAVCGTDTVRSPAGCKTLGANCKDIPLGDNISGSTPFGPVGPNSGKGQFDQNSTTKPYVVFDHDNATRLRSSYIKKSGITKKINNVDQSEVIVDCGADRYSTDTSSVTSVTAPDTTQSTAGQLLVPYVADSKSLISNTKGITFKNIRDISMMPGGNISSCTKDTPGRINPTANPNIRITILI